MRRLERYQWSMETCQTSNGDITESSQTVWLPTACLSEGAKCNLRKGIDTQSVSGTECSVSRVSSRTYSAEKHAWTIERCRAFTA